MKTAKKKAVAKRKPSLPRRVNTIELCKELIAMAGFLEDRRVQEKIYKAVRQLQLLDRFAVEAGLLETKCPKWPHCPCIVQGYVNKYEKDNCGRKPATTPAGIRRQRRADFIRVLGRQRWEEHKRMNPHLHPDY